MLQRVLRFVVLVVIVNLGLRYADQVFLSSKFQQAYHSTVATVATQDDPPLRRSLTEPANFSPSLPADATQRRFAATMSRLVNHENQLLEWQHRRLLYLHSDQADNNDRLWAQALAEKYDIACAENCLSPQTYSQLVQAVDQVPVSALTLAAAVSSRFGVDTSAQKNRNLFVLWQRKPPRQFRAQGVYPWRSFVTWRDSVRAFIHFVNTDAAFAAFRHARALGQPEERQLIELREALLAKTPKYRADWERLQKSLLHQPEPSLSAQHGASADQDV